MSSVRALLTTNNDGDSSHPIAHNTCYYENCSSPIYWNCSHCNYHFCSKHSTTHNEQLAMNTHRFHEAIDQLEEQMQNIRLDEVFRRSVDSLDRWRNSLCQRIERVYQDKLHLIRAKHCQLHVHLQQFQFGQFSQIQALRMDLERNIFIRSTYNQEIQEIHNGIRQLQKNFLELQCDLLVKEYPIVDIENSINCEMIWRSPQIMSIPNLHKMSNAISVNPFYSSQNRMSSDLNIKMDTTSPHSTDKSPITDQSYLRAFLIDDADGDDENSDQSISASIDKKVVPQPTPSGNSPYQELSPTIVVNNNKKYKIKKLCRHCGNYFHPCSLNRHIRQCRQVSSPTAESSRNISVNSKQITS